MNIYAFDVDQTLEVAGGPVKMEQLLNLKKAGNILGIAGNWGKLTKYLMDWQYMFSFLFPVGPDTGKWISLALLRANTSAQRYILVGNEKDRDRLLAAGWEFFLAENFKEGL